ncbi:MAG: HAD-IIIA family hydrolase [Verrucomicrobiae bacterium]|nr:HAD-IIIA family hydrolase [Verrucomicrobiae bacterium]
MRKAIFIERDGILNHCKVENAKQIPPVCSVEFRIKTETINPLAKLKSAGFIIVVITNQPGISRGYLFWHELELMHKRLKEAFPIDDIFVCPHDETDECECMKPKLGLYIEAIYKWKILLRESYVISDKWQDAYAARAMGATSIMINSPFLHDCRHDFLVKDLDEAVEKVLITNKNTVRHKLISNNDNGKIHFVIGDI